MDLHRTVMVLGVVGASHGGAAGQGLAARAHPTTPARTPGQLQALGASLGMG